MIDVVRPVPVALRELLQRWEAAGRPLQGPTSWPVRSWQAWFPEHSEYLGSLPNPITRAHCIAACHEGLGQPDDVVHGFLAAMVWGYGRVGYGPFRTARVLRENDAVTSTLAEAARIARTDGGPQAFEWLSRHRLRGLGVAFATKYLFFCAAGRDGAPALILDRLVRRWLEQNADWALSLDWRVPDYRAYVETVTAWATEVGRDPAELEYLMFAAEATTDPSSQWSEPTLGSGGADASATDPTLTHGEFAVLDALDDAAEAFSALPSAEASDDDDFRRGIRDLRRIVLASRLGELAASRSADSE